MTLQELSLYFKLRERLERDKQILESLQAAACPGAQVMTGMPHSPGIKNKVGDLAVEIADMREEISGLEVAIEEEERRVITFIEAVPDEQMRTILRLRFIRCLTWQEVADIIGGRNTEEGVRKSCYRFLKQA